VEGRFLDETSVAALQDAATKAAADGIDVVFVSTGPLGDAITLAAALSTTTPSILLGIRTNLSTEPHRHPTVLARDMTALDLVTQGRTLLAFTPPFSDAVGEAIALCRHMWRDGVAASDGPHYPVAGAVNRPRPRRPKGPRIALDLTDGTSADPTLVEAVDLLLVPAATTTTTAAAPTLPSGVELCPIQPG
jgi:alkanesulfonate monooxygenase SsuD/methylene tetrahydromethanopterin reductase-like flavin-dependent oxidoreductase (luciferase family)